MHATDMDGLPGTGRRRFDESGHAVGVNRARSGDLERILAARIGRLGPSRLRTNGIHAARLHTA